MTAQAIRTSSITAPAERIEQFVASLRGKVIQPGDADYETARAVYNGISSTTGVGGMTLGGGLDHLSSPA